MHGINIIAFAIPLFLFFIGVEYWVARRQGRNLFQFDRSIANLSIGVAERLTDLFTTSLFFGVYAYLHDHFALFDIKPTVWLWILLLLATDFLWYWYHRLGHEINLFWGVHVVHHQSEDFNYTAATRITVFQAAVRTTIWAVLPVIGFPPGMIITILLVHGAYPFFTHTQLIGKLGVLEYFLVTPSHHRVHHAINPRYLDKNYGDMFIIWDKLFGTFQEEDEQPVFGLTKPLNSHSFLWQHFHFLIEIWYAVQRQHGLLNKLKVVFGRPADFDESLRGLAERRFLSKHKQRASTQRFRGYVLIQLIVSIVVLFCLSLFEHQVPALPKVITGIFLALTLVNIGCILEQRRWVFYLEWVRFSLVAIGLYLYWPHTALIVTGGIVAFIYIFYFRELRRYYLQTLYGSL